MSSQQKSLGSMPEPGEVIYHNCNIEVVRIITEQIYFDVEKKMWKNVRGHNCAGAVWINDATPEQVVEHLKSVNLWQKENAPRPKTIHRGEDEPRFVGWCLCTCCEDHKPRCWQIDSEEYVCEACFKDQYFHDLTDDEKPLYAKMLAAIEAAKGGK